MPDTQYLPAEDNQNPTRSRKVDNDFLPAALEILESPPSPVGRTVIWIVISAALLAITWAFFAQIDMVAVADGRVIPRSRMQSVEAPEAGIVRAIHVSEGQRVEKGQPLLALDPTFAGADATSARIEFETADLARARAEALLQHAAGRAVRFVPPPGAGAAAARAEADTVRARIASLDARLAGIEQRIAGARAAVWGAQAERDKLRETLPLLNEQHASLVRLNREGATTRPQMLDMERRLIENRRDIEVREAAIAQTQAEITMLERERTQAIEEFRGQAAAEKAEAEAIVATRAEGVRKARTREGYQTILSPVAGVINEISLTTLGEVAEAGEPLVTIVPEGEELIVDALVLNRDAGFVRAGHEVIVKLDAYPFTRHGYLKGVVEHISPDATVDEGRGLVFSVRVKITETELRNLELRQVEDQSTPLSAGMSAKAEIITGKRTVLDYLLSPIARAAQEAGRER